DFFLLELFLRELFFFVELFFREDFLPVDLRLRVLFFLAVGLRFAVDFFFREDFLAVDLRLRVDFFFPVDFFFALDFFLVLFFLLLDFFFFAMCSHLLPCFFCEAISEEQPYAQHQTPCAQICKGCCKFSRHFLRAELSNSARDLRRRGAGTRFYSSTIIHLLPRVCLEQASSAGNNVSVES
ncbi:MAG: hypothetical protein ACLFVW_03335, partial [Phycisphaerae bacterium]